MQQEVVLAMLAKEYVPRLRAAGAAARCPRPARRGAESGAGLCHADPQLERAGLVFSERAERLAGSAGPQGGWADPCGAGAGQRVAGGGELAQTRPGRVPSQAGRRRSGEARRPAGDRRRAAPRAVAPAARRPTGGDDRAGRLERCCCWRVSCCASRPTCAGWRYASSAGPCTGVDRGRHPLHTRAGRPRLAQAHGRGEGLVRAVDGVDLDVVAGGVGGGDGAERLQEVDSSHLLGGLDRASDGEVWLGGRRIDQLGEGAGNVCGGATSGSCSRHST